MLQLQDVKYALDAPYIVTITYLLKLTFLYKATLSAPIEESYKISFYHATH